jgi:chromosomal replication initiation ATPase DnaA
METKIKDLSQQLLDFDFNQNFKNEDFFVSKSNNHIFELISRWPKWEKNFLNINGEKNSGKTHLINIFIEKFKGIKIDAKILNNKHLQQIKVHENIILEDLDLSIDEKLLFTLINLIDQDNKYLIVTSLKPIAEIEFNLKDLRSRTKNCLLMKIEKPDDDLIFALILKNLSDRQIVLEKKLVDYIVKRIDRSYDKIFDFIYKIDKISLKKKKSIDFKIIKEALEEQVE